MFSKNLVKHVYFFYFSPVGQDCLYKGEEVTNVFSFEWLVRFGLSYFISSVFLGLNLDTPRFSGFGVCRPLTLSKCHKLVVTSNM